MHCGKVLRSSVSIAAAMTTGQATASTAALSVTSLTVETPIAGVAASAAVSPQVAPGPTSATVDKTCTGVQSPTIASCRRSDDGDIQRLGSPVLE